MRILQSITPITGECFTLIAEETIPRRVITKTFQLIISRLETNQFYLQVNVSCDISNKIFLLVYLCMIELTNKFLFSCNENCESPVCVSPAKSDNVSLLQ